MSQQARAGKMPPHSNEAEQSVLGSVLLDKEAIVITSEKLSPADFYKQSHQEIYEAMLELYQRSEPIDLITLSEQLSRRGTLESIGGHTYLTLLSTIPDFSRHVSQYARIVREKSLLRRLIHAASGIMEEGFAASEDAADLLAKAEKSIFDISQEESSGALVPIKEVLLSAYQMLEELYRNKGGLTGLTTGFVDLDRKTGGLQKTDLILVAARPAMGKTAFGLNLAQNAALKDGASVAIFNLEMNKEQLIQRMLAAESKVDLNKIKSGNLSDEEWPRLITAMGHLSRQNIHIDDTPGIKVLEIRSKCRRLKIEKGLDLVVIDYLQLMEGDHRTENRQQEISKISRSLKILAKELQCPVVALSQVSRAPEQRADHRPILSDLRESGAIEQDADLVMFLYRDDYYNEDSDQKNIAELIISKHRHGETGMVPLTWLGQYQLFHNTALGKE